MCFYSTIETEFFGVLGTVEAECLEETSVSAPWLEWTSGLGVFFFLTFFGGFSGRRRRSRDFFPFTNRFPFFFLVTPHAQYTTRADP